MKRSADAIGEVAMCEALDRIETRVYSCGIAEGMVQANERNMKIAGELT